MIVNIGSYPIGELYADIENGALRALMLGAQFGECNSVTDKEKLSKSDVIVFDALKSWLEAYFEGRILPLDGIRMNLNGSAFQLMVWDELKKIPAGRTTTYGKIAKSIEEKTGKRMAAQAVGGAVGKNPVPILLPCHRVIGADGSLTGYTGGMDKKIWLLKHEGFRIANGRVE